MLIDSKWYRVLYSPDEPVGGPITEPVAEAVVTEPVATPEKMFTQEQVNNYVAAEKRRLSQTQPNEEQIKQTIYSKLGIADDTEVDKINELRESAAQHEKSEREKKGEYEKIIQEKDERHKEREQVLIGERDTVTSKYTSFRIRNVLTEVALRAGADPDNVDLVVDRTEKSVQLADDTNFKVVDAQGVERMNMETGKEMTLDEFMAEFLTSRPKLVQAKKTPGAGSGPSTTTNIDLEEIKRVAKEDPKRYKELKDDGTVERVLGEAAGQ